MIRINLLSVDRGRVKARAAKFQPTQKITALSSLILVVAALGVGWWWNSLRQASLDLDESIAAAEREKTRLQSIINQVEQSEQLRTQLQQRKALIEQLRKGQSGPVHMLDQVSRALPDTMWLVEMKQTNDDITIDGRCTSLTALSDFVGNLEASHYFAPPVEIVDSQVEPGNQTTPELIKFTVKAKFVQPTT